MIVATYKYDTVVLEISNSIMRKPSNWDFPSDGQRLHVWLQIRLRHSYNEKSARLLRFPLSVTM